jgi:hypothetical protein
LKPGAGENEKPGITLFFHPMTAAKSSNVRPQSSPAAKGKRRRNSRRREMHLPKLLAGWQCALTWAGWLTWVWLMWRNSANTSVSGLEFLGLVAAITITLLCRKYPQGVPAVFIEKPEQMQGEFESRTNWALVLIGAGILLGGIASTVRIITHLATGFATVKDVLNDIGVFIVEWIHERLSGGTYDGELEKTQAYILCILIIPGLFMALICLTPFFHRGRNFRVHEDGSFSVRKGDAWETVEPLRYVTVTADGTSILFKESENGAAAVELPMWRVFSRDRGTEVKSSVLAAWLRRELETQGYAIEGRTAKGRVETSWIARRAMPAA